MSFQIKNYYQTSINNKKIDQEELNIIKGTSIKRIVKGELKIIVITLLMDMV